MTGYEKKCRTLLREPRPAFLFVEAGEGNVVSGQLTIPQQRIQTCAVGIA